METGKAKDGKNVFIGKLLQTHINVCVCVCTEEKWAQAKKDIRRQTVAQMIF
jgi:hypothetical protein